jgi:hypothetical protein
MNNYILIPFQSVNKNFNKDLKGLHIKNALDETVGVVISNIHNCGIAMIDKTIVEKSNKFTLDKLNTVIYDPISIYESIRSFKTE